jgi:DNA repair and recombination RAD54-like protein
MRLFLPFASGPHKALFILRFLDKMRAESDDKIVLISNYTETLDVIERLLNAKKCATSCQPLLHFQPR